VDTLGAVQGVVMIPSDVDFSLVASVDSVFFDDIRLEKFKGKIRLKEGVLIMENTGYNLVSADVQMTENMLPPIHSRRILIIP